MVKRKFVDLTKQEKTTKPEDSSKGQNEKIIVHHVPFKLEYEGQANVDSKFTQKSRPLDTDNSVLCNQFRGRPLQGRKINLPKNYEGLIASDLKSSANIDDDGDSSREVEISIVKRFKTMTYWNWDRIPSGMDKHVKLMDWIELSQILHKPIEESQ